MDKVTHRLFSLLPLCESEKEWVGWISPEGEIVSLKQGEEHECSSDYRERRKGEKVRGYYFHAHPTPNICSLVPSHLDIRETCLENYSFNRETFVVTRVGVWRIAPHSRLGEEKERLAIVKEAASLVWGGGLLKVVGVAKGTNNFKMGKAAFPKWAGDEIKKSPIITSGTNPEAVEVYNFYRHAAEVRLLLERGLVELTLSRPEGDISYGCKDPYEMLEGFPMDFSLPSGLVPWPL